MLRRLLPVSLLSIFCEHLHAEDDFPMRLIGFLKPGQHLGLSTRADESTLFVVFKNKIDMETHRDAEKLSVEELRKKYPEVERHANELLAPAKTAETKPSSDAETRKLEIGRSRPLRYGRVLHVGDDYVLLEFENAYRTAYSSNQIGSISGNDGKPNLYLARIDKADRTKR